MSGETLHAMLFVALCFAAMIAFRVLYVIVFYTAWTLDELLGFSDDGWETHRMKENRRRFWR